MRLVPLGVTRGLGKALLMSKKNSPHIFFVGGVLGSITSTVLACKATLKLEPTLDEIQKDLDQAKTGHTHGSVDVEQQKEHFKNLGVIYGQSAVKLGRLYGPSVLIGAASIGALTGSHIQLTRRNSALTATLAVVTKAYDDYRERVREEVGVETELDLYHNVKATEKEVDGKKVVVKAANPDGWSPYARFFDEYSTQWQKNSEMNRIFLQCQQNYFNDILKVRGHVFLNEVYDALGLERSRAGQVVGWVLNGDGDNYIDFGLFRETYDTRFINNLERSVLLDFNVDGVVFDKLEE